MNKYLLLLLAALPATAAMAWDGVEPSTGTKVAITSKMYKVKKGNTVEMFDYGKNEYHDVEIDRISSHGTEIQVEVYDRDMSEERTFLMEGRRKQEQ